MLASTHSPEFKRQLVYNFLRQKAEDGDIFPTNREIVNAGGYRNVGTANKVLAKLEQDGEIIMHGHGMFRYAEIVETGKTTDKRERLERPEYIHILRRPVREIVKIAAEIWNVRTADIYGPSHRRIFARPRFAICCVACDQGWSTMHVGKILARDHSSIINGRNRAIVFAEYEDIYAIRLKKLAQLAAPQKRIAA